MVDRPMLFSGAMVRALLAGAKTQTRRKVKGLPITLNRASNALEMDVANIENGRFAKLRPCPYGQPGDRLWVREAWAETKLAQAADVSMVVYREGDNRTDYGGPWKPSIHMRRRDSRITLEITSVRIEQLQGISEADAKSEGADALIVDNCTAESRALFDLPLHEVGSPHRNGFALLWDSINGDAAWAANPWVWVVEFKRLQEPRP